MDSQIEKLEAHFNSMDIINKKKFIEKLQQKVRDTNADDLRALLGRCTAKYKAETAIDDIVSGSIPTAEYSESNENYMPPKQNDNNFEKMFEQAKASILAGDLSDAVINKAEEIATAGVGGVHAQASILLLMAMGRDVAIRGETSIYFDLENGKMSKRYQEKALKWIELLANTHKSPTFLVALGALYCGNPEIKHDSWQKAFDDAEIRAFANPQKAYKLIEEGIFRAKDGDLIGYDYSTIASAYKYRADRNSSNAHSADTDKDREKVIKYLEKAIEWYEKYEPGGESLLRAKNQLNEARSGLEQKADVQTRMNVTSGGSSATDENYPAPRSRYDIESDIRSINEDIDNANNATATRLEAARREFSDENAKLLNMRDQDERKRMSRPNDWYKGLSAADYHKEQYGDAYATARQSERADKAKAKVTTIQRNLSAELTELDNKLDTLKEELAERMLYDNDRPKWIAMHKKKQDEETKIQRKLQSEYESCRAEFKRLTGKVSTAQTESELNNLANEFSSLSREINDLRYHDANEDAPWYAPWYQSICALSDACSKDRQNLTDRAQNLKRTREAQEKEQANDALCAKLANEMRRVNQMTDATHQITIYQRLAGEFRAIKGHDESSKLADECYRRYRELESRIENRKKLLQKLPPVLQGFGILFGFFGLRAMGMGGGALSEDVILIIFIVILPSILFLRVWISRKKISLGLILAGGVFMIIGSLADMGQHAGMGFIFIYGILSVAAAVIAYKFPKP